MVGTAVYQVGLHSFIQAKNLSALKPGVHKYLAARGKRRQHPGNQAMDVEQRHHMQLYGPWVSGAACC
jgi:hypothetical protein